MPDVVQIVSKAHWDRKLDRSRFLSVRPLVSRVTGPGWPDWTPHESAAKNLKRIHGRIPDVVLGYKCERVTGFSKLPCMTVLTYNEVKPFRFLAELEACEPDILVFHHANDWFLWRSTLRRWGRRSTHIPHAADPAIFKPSDKPKDIDVLLIGDRDPRVYPLRNAFDKAADLLDDLTVVRHEHPGYDFDDAVGCGHLRAFAEAISRAKIACFCSSHFHYRLQKFVEVPACGTLIAADIPVVEQGDGLVDHIHSFDVSEPTEFVAYRLRALCPGLTDGLRHAGLEYAAQHTPQTYSSRLRAFLEK